MNFKLFLSFFLAGLGLGSSLCLLNCGLLLFPFITLKGKDWKQGLQIGLLFGAGKIISYGCLGGLASFSHRLLQRCLENPVFYWVGGILLLCIGGWFVFHEETCRRNKVKETLPGFLAGLVYGFLPCLPLYGFLLYLVYVSPNIFYGVLAGSVFGLGTLFSPLLVLWGILPYVGQSLAKLKNGKLCLKIIGVAILFSWGISLLLKGTL